MSWSWNFYFYNTPGNFLLFLIFPSRLFFFFSFLLLEEPKWKGRKKETKPFSYLAFLRRKYVDSKWLWWGAEVAPARSLPPFGEFSLVCVYLCSIGFLQSRVHPLPLRVWLPPFFLHRCQMGRIAEALPNDVWFTPSRLRRRPFFFSSGNKHLFFSFLFRSS